MRTRVRASLSLLAAALALGGVGVSTALGADPVDVARELKSRDYKKRLAAVDTLAKDGGENAAGLLEDALKDDDWEVAERAAAALADRGRPESVRPLAVSASEGRVWRLRRAASRALARLDPEAAAKELTKDLRGDAGVEAAEALALIAQGAGAKAGDLLRKGLDRALKAKDAPIRAAAASGLAGLAAEARPEHFTRLLNDPDLTVASAVLTEAARAPEPAYFTPIVTRFEEPALNDVLERRAAAAILASLVAITVPAERASRVAEMSAAFARAKEPAAAGRFARLFGLLAAAPPPVAPEEPKGDGKAPPAGDPPPPAKPAPPAEPVVAADVALKALAPALEHRGEAARASAAFALGRIRSPEALARAAQMARGDAHPRVRLQALRVAATGRGVADPDTLALVVDRLAKDAATSVREEAAVLLGEPGPDGKPFDAPVKALEAALADPEWTVVVVAAVSLGKTQSPAAVEPLRRLTAPKEVKDWRVRGAAVVGLGTLRQKGAVPPLIESLVDKDPSVRRTAYEYLRRLTPLSILAEPEPWRRWWDRAAPNYEFTDRQKAAREAKKGGYAPTPVEVYEKIGTAHLDVLVLQSRGDHIEKLLTELKINHRITRAGALPQAELNPFCIFVSNCTGEVLAEDADRLKWFVRVGGYLFCSCWALHYTVELVYPGVVQKLPTKAEVLDNVVAEACPGNSPFLDGVFPDFTRPVYVLYGSHLIDVLQPERVEVLIDSPGSAQHWGGGNLACWFSAGHGVILDSANHFDLQGLQRVNGLKTGPDRMAYAMDHLGVDYEEARAFADSHVWEKQADAMERVRDLSTFRFITNFVRQKRKVDL